MLKKLLVTAAFVLTFGVAVCSADTLPTVTISVGAPTANGQIANSIKVPISIQASVAGYRLNNAPFVMTYDKNALRATKVEGNATGSVISNVTENENYNIVQPGIVELFIADGGVDGGNYEISNTAATLFTVTFDVVGALPPDIQLTTEHYSVLGTVEDGQIGITFGIPAIDPDDYFWEPDWVDFVFTGSVPAQSYSIYPGITISSGINIYATLDGMPTNVTAGLRLDNTSGAPIEAYLVLVVYDPEGRLAPYDRTLVAEKLTIAAGNNVELAFSPVLVSSPFPEQEVWEIPYAFIPSPAAGHSARAFLFRADNMKPLANSVIVQ